MIFVKFLRSVNLRRTSGQERSGKWSGTPDNLTDGLTAFISPLFVKVWTVWFKTGKVKFQWNLVPEKVQISINLPYKKTTINLHQPRRCTGHRGSIGDWHRLSGNTCQRIPQLSILSMLSASFIIFQHRQHILYVMEHNWNTVMEHICAVLPWSPHGVHRACHWKILVAAQDLKIAEDPEALEPQIATDHPQSSQSYAKLCWLYAGYHDPIFFNRSQQHTIQNFERKGTWTFFTRHAVRRFSEDLFPSEQTRQILAPGSMIYHDLGGCKKNQEDPQFHNMATTSARELHHIPSPYFLSARRFFLWLFSATTDWGWTSESVAYAPKKTWPPSSWSCLAVKDV